MTKPGHQRTKGVGEKEPDGSPRDTRIYCKLPKAVVERLKSLASERKVSITDLVSEAIQIYLENNP